MIYSQTLKSINDLPKKDEDRKCTDIACSIIGVVFGGFMLTMAFVMWKKENYYKSNFPTDSDGIPCGYAENQRYPMVYFPEIQNRDMRVCVSVCPNQGDKQLICRRNSKVSCKFLNVYQTVKDFERLGGFCAPTDHALRDRLIQRANLSDKWRFLNTFDTIALSLLIASGIGIVWFIMVQLLPHAMAAVAISLAVLVSIATGILLIIDTYKGYEGKQLPKLIAGIIILLIAAFIASFILLFKRRIRLMGLYLAWSTQWASQKLVFVIWIPIFIVSTLGLMIIILFQHLAYISNSDPRPHESDIYLKLDPNLIWQILNIIQFIWGLQFLKDSFNFIISGSATQWYLQQSENGFCFTFSRMIKNHFGSVVGGSFLNAFFGIINFVLQSLRCYPQGKCNRFAPCCNLIFGIFPGFLCNFVRTDVYSYINMAGIPYCNACRNCQQINRKQSQFAGAQSIQFFYRGCSYISCVGISFLICYFIEKAKIDGINVESLIVVMLVSYSIQAYFIDFHANAAEGIHVTSILQRNFGSERSNRAHKKWKQDLKQLASQEPSQGSC